MRRITLRELRLLLAVGGAGSILKAAERVALSQPAVSRAVADLERTLGVKLFDRTNRGVEPTPQGRILLERAHGMFDEMRMAVEEMGAVSNSTGGEVRVGGTPAMCGGLLPHAAALVAQRRPGVRHQLDEMESERLASALRERSLDIALGRAPAEHADGAIAFESLFEDRVFIVAGICHPLAARRKLAMAHLAGQQWLLPAADTQTTRQLGDALYRAGVILPPSSITTMSILMRYQLLQTGRFLTAMHGSPLRFGWFPGLRVLPLELPASIRIGLSRLRGRTLAPAAEAFADVIRDLARSIAGLSASDLNDALQRQSPGSGARAR